jgi:hypothetical protein
MLDKIQLSQQALSDELYHLVPWLQQHQISLEVLYIRSEHNIADPASRRRDADLWSLKPRAQNFLLQEVHQLLGQPVDTDPFACHQSAVATRYCTPLHDRSINHLLQQASRSSTKKSYNSKVDKFQDFCGRVQDEAGTPRLSSMPASQTTIFAFIGYLASFGRIRSSSLQQYLSAINSLHAGFGFPKPAQGHWISLACKGFGEIEGSFNQAPTKAAAFPASYMLSILIHGLQDSASSHQVLACACLTAQFAFFSRADSGINLEPLLALSRRTTGNCSSYHDLASFRASSLGSLA